MKRCVLFVLVVVALGADSPKNYDDATSRADELEGTWRIVKGNGQIATMYAGKWEFYQGTFLVSKGTYTSNADRLPAQVDETLLTGGNPVLTHRCIYRLDGDTLRIGHLPDANVRPRSFDEAGIVVVTYERVK